MAVFMRDQVVDLNQDLFNFVSFKCVNGLACGVILARCANLNQKVLDSLKNYMSKHQPELSAQYVYDDHNQVLSILLDNWKLSATHYTSLILKDFLQDHHFLEGSIVIASFPESGEPSSFNLSQLVGCVTHPKKESKEIRIFTDQSTGEEIQSILVVDTDEVVREFVRLRLELQGYAVSEAKDGHEALEKYSLMSPDLIITELNLPILDGYQLMNQINKRDSKSGKVIVLTDKHLSSHMNRAFELGAADYITKPFSISELTWRIKKLNA
ncbi:response regulator transcription factor [Ammoniphilus resinae]|uniref:CheY-like chemotaxis protein n=1 Tax=Ammoniphilus resinae TaxID=861532 RepID=A0ABS4GM54_9BACL|nr:response regulator [Ammoniphilus resinae]MBP1930970.1 CheY-like chemotaxis protein [Ammoniphilus resinae]